MSGSRKEDSASLVTGAEEAEEVTNLWLQKRFLHKLRKIRIKEIELTEGKWDVKTEIVIRSGALSDSTFEVQMKIDAQTAKVTAYSEKLLQK